jgi:hypothetical protein
MAKIETLNPRDLQRELDERYPDLRVIQEDERAVVRGSFPILHEDSVIDRFQIEVELPTDFPDSFPLTWEVGGRLPRTTERHSFISGAACLLVPEEWLSLPREKRTLLSFFSGPVHNYFLGQCFVEIGLPWPHGERGHGIFGIIESFMELLGVDDVRQILRYLHLLEHDRIKGHWECPCGSGNVIRRCHVDHIRNLQQRVTPAVASKALKRFFDQYEQYKRQQKVQKQSSG